MNLTSARMLICGGETLAGAALAEEANRRGLTPQRLRQPTPPTGPTTMPLKPPSPADPEVVFVAAGESGGIALNRAHPHACWNPTCAWC